MCIVVVTQKAWTAGLRLRRAAEDATQDVVASEAQDYMGLFSN